MNYRYEDPSEEDFCKDIAKGIWVPKYQKKSGRWVQGYCRRKR